ncbi:MAG: hypothetical protein E3K37_05595 [Candidatus Kuenenia sp.]|nr:hypothetical protein [Candidatus Kuenenia hertensis]
MRGNLAMTCLPTSRNVYIAINQINYWVQITNLNSQGASGNALLLMPYAVEIRYPDDWFMPVKEDAEEAREAVSRAMSWLQNALPEAFSE